MKRLICLFGQPGSGRRTFISNVMNKNDDVLKSFNLVDKNILFATFPYNREYFITDYRALDNRSDIFYKTIVEFLSSEADVIIINCEHVDYVEFNKSVLKRIADAFGELDKEIIMLNPMDESVGYDRLKNTEWFKSDNSNNWKFPIEWYRFAIKYMRDYLFKYEELGFKVFEVDTTNGYQINHDKPKKLELKNN